MWLVWRQEPARWKWSRPLSSNSHLTVDSTLLPANWFKKDRRSSTGAYAKRATLTRWEAPTDGVPKPDEAQPQISWRSGESLSAQGCWFGCLLLKIAWEWLEVQISLSILTEKEPDRIGNTLINEQCAMNDSVMLVVCVNKGQYEYRCLWHQDSHRELSNIWFQFQGYQ